MKKAIVIGLLLGLFTSCSKKEEKTFGEIERIDPALDAIVNKGRPVADIEEGHISTASCILANLSMQTGRPLIYDPKQRVIVNDREATGLLQRPYRQPWEHPKAGLI